MEKYQRLVSKTRYLQHMQCPLEMWKNTHAREDLEYDQGMEDRIAEGNEIESLYLSKNHGDVITADYKDWRAGQEATEALLKNGSNRIYEATFVSECFKACRVDVFERNTDGTYTQKEIKNTTSIKEGDNYKSKYLLDAAFQRWVLQLAGFNVGKTILVYLNKEYIRQGDLDLDQLFVEEDVTDACEAQIQRFKMNDKTSEILEIINNKEQAPEIEVGLHCIKAGRNCNALKSCLKKAGADKSFMSTFFSTSRQWKLRKEIVEESRVLRLEDVTEDQASKFKNIAKLDYEFFKDGKALYYYKEKIIQFTDNLVFPLSQFDFETFKSAIPLFDGVRTHQQIPFQFSVHIAHEDGEVEHKEFLHLERSQGKTLTDPRPSCIDHILRMIPETGSILAWNASFEEGRIRELAEQYPKYKDFLNSLIPRLVSIDHPFSFRYLYLPEMKSSFSLKKVGPSTLGDKINDYSSLNISKGDEAMSLYTKIAKNHTVYSDTDLDRIREDFLVYCKFDTINPTLVTDFLFYITGQFEKMTNLTKGEYSEVLTLWDELLENSQEYNKSQKNIIEKMDAERLKKQLKKVKQAS